MCKDYRVRRGKVGGHNPNADENGDDSESEDEDIGDVFFRTLWGESADVSPEETWAKNWNF
ncbi:hypothetical protein NUU61_008742 [Penicillium alfredii]|uniref:Uncharacterized protein n=1 Tax=Penicillium alfredii TaxID=1506179 RepID=A0A9W9JWI7_9EURO|nr:uncharacterized protein NUU61_008742 [Penicillium alfredii]KAJ5084163.1 hypothetical protein NUU61_008742 [Penicillium alfredii]